ncbi:MAG: hypothetical protein V3V32_04420 [Dehalococcoidia bacterium]
MINRTILEARRDIYVKGRAQAQQLVSEKLAQIASITGAIECLDDLLRLLDQLEPTQQEEDINKEEINATAIAAN